MVVELNTRINKRYIEIWEHLSAITESKEDAIGILWLSVRQLAEQSDLPYKGDCKGILQSKIIGTDEIFSSIIADIENSSERKDYLVERYQFGEKVNALGVYWKELIKEEKAFRLRMMYGVVHAMRTGILPFANKVVKDWKKDILENEAVQNTDVACNDSAKNYRAYLARLRKTEQIFLVASEIIELQRTRDEGERLCFVQNAVMKSKQEKNFALSAGLI